ncbi:tape measure protein [Arthrobacter sp. HY1533]|uniref:tape measure protein n=1 Tax=Arthrobacter sp. HY1533 TaxID=2970919 RepID=UPI003FA4D17B
MSGVGEAAGAKASGGFISSIGGIAGRVVGIAGAGVAAIGGLIGSMAVKGGIDRQLNIEGATTKLEGLKLSTGQVSAVMGNALDSVRGTAFGLGDAATVAAGAIGAAIPPGKELTAFLSLTADAATQAGIDLNSMGQMMNKVAGQGKLTGDVVQQMAQNGLYVMPMLAKSYGVSQEAMTKMVSKGEVDAATFQRVLRENIGGSALKSGDTTVGAYDNMRAAMSRVGVSMTSWFFPLVKNVFQQITLIFDGLNARVGPSMTQFGEWFQGKATPYIANFATTTLAALDEVVGGIRAFGFAFKEGGDEVTSAGFAGVLEHLGLITRNVWDYVQPVLVAIGNGFKSLFSGIQNGNFEGLGGNIGTIFSALQNLAQPLGMVMITVGSHIGAVGTQLGLLIGNTLPLLAPLIQIAADAMGFLADHTELLTPIVVALAAAFLIYRTGQTAANFAEIGALPIKAAGVVANIALANSNNALAAAMAVSNGQQRAGFLARIPAVAQVIAHTVANIAHGVALVATSVAMGVATAAQWLWNAAMSANPIGLIILAIAALIAIIVFLVMNWDSVVSFVTTIWGNFVNWLVGIVNTVAAWWSGVWAGIVGFFSDAWNNIVNFVRTAILVFGIIIQVGMNTARDIVSNVLNAIGNFFSTIWNNIVTAVRTAILVFGIIIQIGLNTARDIVSNVLNAIGSFFSGMFNFYLSIVRNVIGFVVSVISSGMNNASSVVSGVLGAIGGFFSSTWNNIVNGVSGAIGQVVGFFSGLGGQVLGAIGDIGGRLFGIGQSIIQSLYDGLMSVWGKVTDFVGGIAGWIADHKGPESLDRVLLRPHGGWIMGGLVESLDDQIPNLEESLNRVTATVTGHHVGQLRVGQADASNLTSIGAQLEASGAGRKGPEVNYHGNVYGFDPEEAPRKWEQDLADASAVAGLRNEGKVI